METWVLELARLPVRMENGETYVKTVPEFESFFSSAGGRRAEETLSSLAENPPDKKVHER